MATNNPGKAREIGALFAFGELLSLADFGLHFTPREDGKTFAENATQKATETLAFLKASGVEGLEKYLVLADDSGLVIDALGGEPGVDSALYLGVDTPYDIRNAHIINRLKDVPDDKRLARFVCVAACVLPGGEVITCTATLEGCIAHQPTGNNGFGYDPIFWLPKRGLTLAQLSIEEKNAISHRGKAMRKMARKLDGLI